MATIEFIQKRIDGKSKEIEKLTKKLARIEKAEATGWRDNPYYYSDYDKRICLKDLEAAKDALAKYQAELAATTEKAASRNIPAILEFLDRWKARVTRIHLDAFGAYPEAVRQREKDLEPFRMDYFEERKFKRERPDEWKEWSAERKAINEQFNAAYGFIEPYLERVLNPETMRYDSWRFDEEKLAKELSEEANRKYDFIIERTNKLVGEITDANGLSVGAKGDLNGIIIGTRGNASVKTIGAGGYNIQCFHFRTLIHQA